MDFYYYVTAAGVVIGVVVDRIIYFKHRRAYDEV